MKENQVHLEMDSIEHKINMRMSRHIYFREAATT